ncbi:MAG TPA: DNA topoisomerase I, partial [Candidatus Taylorbacteria bacterium]|nr:DNA topoisomerase I [Candidatus Taylorbacteria bacterium]
NAQEAHEAIRPTDSNRENAAGAEDQKRVYRLIWQRAVASQMSDAKLLRTKITATVGADTPNFFATGSRLTFPGWLMADPESRGEELELPKVTKGETLTLLALADVEKETEPPSRYTEAGLVKELEKRGIGRPSTYASIIGTIEERGYAEMVGRA